MEFIDLNGDDSLINVTENSTLLTKPKVTTQLLSEEEIPQVEYIPKTEVEKDTMDLQSSCGIEQYYPDASKEDYFKRENLFSELVNDFQRAKARYNLGIGDAYSLNWGNISGLIDRQQDLVALINNTFATHANQYTESINNLLVQWGIEINHNLSQKLNKYSPQLEGVPTTTLPDLEDNSSRIASTEWVNSRIALSGDYNLSWIRLDKAYMFYGDSPQTLTLTWEFFNAPEEIRINGTAISNTAVSYSFFNVNADLSINFSYRLGEKWYSRIINFEKVYAYYYGVDNEVASMTKTKNSLIIVNSLPNKFVYLYLPNDGNARLSVDNILGGFKVLGTTLIDNINYYIYQTVNSGLGQLYIKYDKQ